MMISLQNKLIGGAALAALAVSGVLYVMLLRADLAAARAAAEAAQAAAHAYEEAARRAVADAAALAAARDRADADHRAALDLIDTASDQCLDRPLPDGLIEGGKQ